MSHHLTTAFLSFFLRAKSALAALALTRHSIVTADLNKLIVDSEDMGNWSKATISIFSSVSAVLSPSLLLK